MPIADDAYRCPTDLAVTPAVLSHVLIVGSCLSSAWPDFISRSPSGCPCDFLVINNSAQLPEAPPRPVQDYDFQFIQIPLRVLMPEYTYFGLSYTDTESYERLFAATVKRLSQFLALTMKWNVQHGILTFVSNFLIPQQNPMGRLLPRYDLRNFVCFIEKLNESLATELEHYANAYLFDFDQIVSTFGRRYFQDDAVYQIAHGAALSAADFARDQNRIEPVLRITETYPLRVQRYIGAAWSELVAMYRSLRQIDQVKLVIVDIDDTLWRGVAAEAEEVSAEAIEGWPLGVIEALCHLRRRGVLLAVVSKNAESITRTLWPRILGRRLKLEDFAIRKINWRTKSENVEEILRELNLLPNSVVFLDDNPLERASIEAAFPGIRTLGPNPYVWRRVLLWSPETQLSGITPESASRTEMVRAQLEREMQRNRSSREEFLASIDLRVKVFELRELSDKRFPRALELINKTNQFNTTGKRRSREECARMLSGGARLFAFDVQDRFTEYGLTGVVIVDGAHVEQFVMSCRVVGMDVELAAVSEIVLSRLGGNKEPITASLVATERNLLSRDLFAKCGFTQVNGEWRALREDVALCPGHIRLATETPDEDGSGAHAPPAVEISKVADPIG